MSDLMKFFHARRTAYHTSPKLIDQVIYTPYLYDPPAHDPRLSPNSVKSETQPLLAAQELLSGEEDLEQPSRVRRRKGKFYSTPAEAEIFLFEYGTLVIWGMTEAQEKRFLSSMLVMVLSRLLGSV
jgi:uncharacterized Rmd1/YagE family protein